MEAHKRPGDHSTVLPPITPTSQSPEHLESPGKLNHAIVIAMPEKRNCGGAAASSREEDQLPMKETFRRWTALTALAFMWTSAQAPLYLFGGAPVYIYRELGGTTYWVWFIAAYLLAAAAISPFVGALSDLFGRRYVAIIGNSVVIVGQIICGTANGMDMFIAGMTVTGVGAGINELTALAGTAELVPVSQRGYYVAGMILTILPFLPCAMYAQLISAYSDWRYIALVTSLWTFIGLILTIAFYFPPGRFKFQGTGEKITFLKRMDLLGGGLSIAGLSLFEAGILGAGYQFPWASAQALVPIIIGGLCLVAFASWEHWAASNPIIPRQPSKAPRTLALTMIIIFISGANFFSVLMLWPGEAYNVYGHNPVGVGVRGMPFAFGTFTGCFISLIFISWFRGHVKWLVFISSVLMTVGCGCLSLARVDNIHAVYGILFIAGLGVGGITVPVSTIATIVCKGEYIATITALTFTVRIVGGAVGYTVYYNVFAHKLVSELKEVLGMECVRLGITNPTLIAQVINLTAASLVKEIRYLPGVNENTWAQLVLAGQTAFSNAYPWAYYCSVGFGAVSVLASLFLEDLTEMMDDSVVAMQWANENRESNQQESSS